MEYWLELEKRFDEGGESIGWAGPRLLQEVIDLRGKVSFYESRIAEMAKFLTKGQPHG